MLLLFKQTGKSVSETLLGIIHNTGIVLCFERKIQQTNEFLTVKHSVKEVIGQM